MAEFDRRYSDKKPAPPSPITSQWLDEQVKMFLAKGGKIEQVPEGKTALEQREYDE